MIFGQTRLHDKKIKFKSASVDQRQRYSKQDLNIKIAGNVNAILPSDLSHSLCHQNS